MVPTSDPFHPGLAFPKDLCLLVAPAPLIAMPRPHTNRTPQDGESLLPHALGPSTEPFLALGMVLPLLFSLVLPLVLGACDSAPKPGSNPLASDGGERGLVVIPGPAQADPSGPQPGSEGAPDRLNFHSFGEVPDGTVATFTFRMRNAEARPIAITGIHPGCGCTAAEVVAFSPTGESIAGQKPDDPHEPWIVVPVGGTVDLTLRIDTRDIASKNKDRTLTTRVVTDSEVGRYRTFELHLFVAQDLQINPKRLDLGQVPVGLGAAGTVDIVPVGRRELEVVGVGSAPEGVRVEVSPAEIMGQATWTVLASLDPPLELGQLFGLIKIETRFLDGRPGHDLDIPFQARIVPDLHVSPQRLVLLHTPPATGPTNRCSVYSLQPGERLTVLSSRVEGDASADFELKVEPDEPDALGRSHRWTVTLEHRGQWPSGLLRGDVVLELERSREAELRIPWVLHPE